MFTYIGLLIIFNVAAISVFLGYLTADIYKCLIGFFVFGIGSILFIAQQIYNVNETLKKIYVCFSDAIKLAIVICDYMKNNNKEKENNDKNN